MIDMIKMFEIKGRSGDSRSEEIELAQGAGSIDEEHSKEIPIDDARSLAIDGAIQDARCIAIESAIQEARGIAIEGIQEERLEERKHERQTES